MNGLRDLLARRWRGLLKRLRFHDAHWWADPYRVITRRFADEYQGSQYLTPVANYSIDSRVPLSPDSIVYSAGVGRDISFDSEIARRFGARVFMFDPTPDSIDFIAEQNLDPTVTFEAIGVWSEDKVLAFGSPRLWTGSASAMDLMGEVPAFEADCRRIPTIMATHGHAHIDVLKMDIEGAALPVLADMIEEGILPDQIVVEFERPRRGASAFACFLADVKTICDQLEDLGYEIVLLPRDRSRYFSLEYLFVRKTAITATAT